MSINDLPQEMIMSIIEYLPDADMLALGVSCKEFRNTVSRHLQIARKEIFYMFRNGKFDIRAMIVDGQRYICGYEGRNMTKQDKLYVTKYDKYFANIVGFGTAIFGNTHISYSDKWWPTKYNSTSRKIKKDNISSYEYNTEVRYFYYNKKYGLIVNGDSHDFKYITDVDRVAIKKKTLTIIMSGKKYYFHVPYNGVYIIDMSDYLLYRDVLYINNDTGDFYTYSQQGALKTIMPCISLKEY